MVKHIHGIPGNKSEEQENADQILSKKDSRGQTSSGQYFRIANVVIKEKIDKLKHFQEGMRRLSDGDTLQNRIKSRKDLDEIDPKYITELAAKNLIARLEEEYERTLDKLLCQELIIEKTKDEISAKRREIDEIKEKLEEVLQKRQKEREDMLNPIEALKEELKKAGVDDSTQIYQMINEVAETLNMKNLKGHLNK